MKARYVHNWQMTPDHARQKQRELAAMVVTENQVKNVHLVAGVDISAPDARGLARAAVVVLRYPGMELQETKEVEQEPGFPYVPGLLSFREAPLILAACEKLNSEPDLVLVDGQGIAHPRRLGLASHLGVLWDKPTIGCAKSRLCGTHKALPEDQGAYTELTDNGEVIGAVLRTRRSVKPLYISIG
ncbi:MAG: endonuclease V, partial [Chloroflexota bacterium]|nr:endonuclease V [Chloroflexota bacterium]